MRGYVKAGGRTVPEIALPFALKGDCCWRARVTFYTRLLVDAPPNVGRDAETQRKRERIGQATFIYFSTAMQDSHRIHY